MAGRIGDSVDRAIQQASVDSGRSMSSGARGAGGDTSDNELYKLNQVFYRSIPSLSTVTKRTLVRSNFQQTSYSNLSGAVIQCIINTGELFVSGPQSWLMLQFGVPFTSPGNEPKQWDFHAFLGPGGIGSIIDEVWLTSASGTEICREQNKGLQLAHYLQNTMTPEYLRRSGNTEGLPSPNVSDLFSARGYCQNTGAAGVAGKSLGPIRNKSGTYLSGGVDNTAAGNLNIITPPSQNDQGAIDVVYLTADTGAVDPAQNRTRSDPYQFAIPMSHLLGCFNPYMKVLFPGIALAGATLSIRFKDFQEPLIFTGTAITRNGGADPVAYTRGLAQTAVIPSIYILWDTYQMNDAVVKKVNEISAGPDGLTLMFDTWDWTSNTYTGTQFEVQVSQARSRVKMGFCVLRDNASITNPFIPSLCSEGASRRTLGPGAYNQLYTQPGNPQLVLTYQAILGSLYFPQQPLQTIAEYHSNQLYMFGKDFRDDSDTSCINIEDVAGARGPAEIYAAGVPVAPSGDPAWAFPYGMALYGLTCERSSLLQLTGLTISNAKLLRHRFTLSTGTTVSATNVRRVDAFTQFTRQMKVFLGGRVVMRE